MKKILIAVLVLVLIGGGWYAYSQKNADVKSESLAASPSPTPGFGDDGDEGGTVVDSSAAVRQNILGQWRSTTDVKFLTDFKADGTVVESYNGEIKSKGTWEVYTKEKPVDTLYPLEAGFTYVRLTMPPAIQSKPGFETYDYKLAMLTVESLQLVNLGNGGVLVFSRID